MTTDTAPTQTHSIAYQFFYGSFARTFSFLVAVSLSILVQVYPAAFAPTGVDSLDHGTFTWFMIGIAIGFIHGVGYIPKNLIWRVLFGPWVAWPLMIGGGIWLLT